MQNVIAYLAQSGVTFSIHNACKKICVKSHKADFNWLYDWCHDHEQKIRDAVDASPTAWTRRKSSKNAAGRKPHGRFATAHQGTA